TAQTLTLGGLIEHLRALPPGTNVPLGLDVDSYRGYYEHVYVVEGEVRAAVLADYLSERLGDTMMGYKGGEFTIREDCDVFVAQYGCTGPRLALDDVGLVKVQDRWDS